MDQETIVITGRQLASYAGRKVTHGPFLSTKTAIVDLRGNRKPEQAIIDRGFELLTKWEVILQFRDYTEMAADLLTGEEAERARGQILDLRQPVFENRIIFLKDTAKARSFYDAYQAETTDPRAALLLALWQTKPQYHALARGGWR